MKQTISNEVTNKVIRMAWEDRTTFDEIEKSMGLSESDVIKVMRKNLKPSSFKMWRKRVSGRITKHSKKFQQSRQDLKNTDQQNKSMFVNKIIGCFMMTLSLLLILFSIVFLPVGLITILLAIIFFCLGLYSFRPNR